MTFTSLIFIYLAFAPKKINPAYWAGRLSRVIYPLK